MQCSNNTPFLCWIKPLIRLFVAMKGLREKNLITMDEVGYIELTNSGLMKAEKVLERHNLLAECLIKIGVSEKVAMEDACRIEHDISEETFEALKNHCLK